MSNDNKIPSNAGKLYPLPAITPPPHWQGDRTKLQATMQQPTVDEVVAARRISQPGSDFNTNRFLFELIVRSIVQLGGQPASYRDAEQTATALGVRVFETWGEAAKKLCFGGDEAVNDLMRTGKVVGDQVEYTLPKVGPLWGTRSEKDKTFRWRDPTVGEIIEDSGQDIMGLESYPEDLVGLLSDSQFRRVLRRIVSIGGVEMTDEDKARWLRQAGPIAYLNIQAMSGMRQSVPAQERASFLAAIDLDSE